MTAIYVSASFNKNKRILVMTRTIGSILTIGGIVGLIYTGINYLNDTESFGFLGADVVVSRGNPVPIIIFGVVLVLGILLLRSK